MAPSGSGSPYRSVLGAGCSVTGLSTDTVVDSPSDGFSDNIPTPPAASPTEKNTTATIFHFIEANAGPKQRAIAAAEVVAVSRVKGQSVCMQDSASVWPVSAAASAAVRA